MPEYLPLPALPPLRDPVLVAAFTGWNDAAEAASSSVHYLADAWSARRVASFDGEEFFDYTETRPHVRLVDGLTRAIEWPSLDLYLSQDESRDSDMLLLVGAEPQLRWRTFVREVTGMLDVLGVRRVALLGALLADVPHTRAPRLAGSASDDGVRERLDELGILASRYEGPTGIVGVLQDACGHRGIETVSLWGNVPHYITASPNPAVSAALLRALDTLLGLGLNLHALESGARRFRERVDEAIARSPEAVAFVQELEARDEDETPRPGPLPSGAEIVRELEEFLRQQREE